MATQKTTQVDLPNGEKFEIPEGTKDVVVYVTHRNGEKLKEPYARTFNHQNWDDQKKNKFITGTVVYDPRAPKKEPKQAPTSEADKLKAEYQKITGNEADGRWGVDKLEEEIEAAKKAKK